MNNRPRARAAVVLLAQALWPWILGAICLFYLIHLAWAQSQVTVPPNAPATPVVSATAEGSHVLKPSPGALLAFYVTSSSGAAGFILIFNSTTIPADGAVTPIECIPITAGPSYAYANFAPQPPEWYSTGISAAYSTTGCFTKTVSSGAFFHALVQ